MTTKTCNICKETKPIKKFPKCLTCIDGHNNFCNTCKRKKPYWKESKRRYGRKKMLEKFQLDVEKYKEMFDCQEGKCAICKKKQNVSLAVDHDHETGKIRALLCRNCNLALGNFKDNVNNLKEAINYLEKHKNSQCEPGVFGA